FGGTGWVPVQWSTARLRELVGYGVNVQAMAIVMLLFEPIAKIWFTRFGGLSVVGYFELAEQLVTRLRAVIVESNRVLVPVVAGLRQVGGNVRQLYTRNLSYLLVLLTPLFAFVAAAMPAVGEVWTG